MLSSLLACTWSSQPRPNPDPIPTQSRPHHNFFGARGMRLSLLVVTVSFLASCTSFYLEGSRICLSTAPIPVNVRAPTQLPAHSSSHDEISSPNIPRSDTTRSVEKVINTAWCVTTAVSLPLFGIKVPKAKAETGSYPYYPLSYPLKTNSSSDKLLQLLSHFTSKCLIY